MKKQLEKVQKILLIVPIIIMIVILGISMYLFDKDKTQTYERVRGLKEAQVQMVTSEVDHVIAYSEGELTREEIDMVSTVVTELNKEQGVYCYLYNKDCELLSEHSGTADDMKISNDIKKQLESGNYSVIESHYSYGWVEVKLNETGEYTTVYWQGIPSNPNRTECDFFIILAVSENNVEGNDAITSFKVMISILTIALTFSLYGNILKLDDCEECKKKNKNS